MMWPWKPRGSVERKLRDLAKDLTRQAEAGAEAAQRFERAGLRDKAFHALGRSQGLMTAVFELRHLERRL